MKKKCYIAGKIGGLDVEVFTKNFEQAKQEVAALGYEPVSPVDLPHNHGRTWAEYMREDLRAMLECEAVYALSNWRTSPGANIEVNLALNVGLTILHQPC